MKFLCYIIILTNLAACGYNHFEPLDPTPEKQWNATHSIAQLVEGTVKGEVVVSGVVATSDSTGNFYKEFIIVDPLDGRAFTVGIGIYSSYALYPIGSRVAIRLTGQSLQYDQGLFAVNFPASLGASGNYIQRQGQSEPFQWRRTTINALSEMRSGTLVEIPSIYFPSAGDTTYSGNVKVAQLIPQPQSETSVNLYTSPYASFASAPLPSGVWTLRAILLRRSDKVELRFTDAPYLKKQL